jgi:hypothetical protein
MHFRSLRALVCACAGEVTLRTTARYNDDDEKRQRATRLLLLAAVAVFTVHRLLLLSVEISKPLRALPSHSYEEPVDRVARARARETVHTDGNTSHNTTTSLHVAYITKPCGSMGGHYCPRTMLVL